MEVRESIHHGTSSSTARGPGSFQLMSWGATMLSFKAEPPNRRRRNQSSTQTLKRLSLTPAIQVAILFLSATKLALLLGPQKPLLQPVVLVVSDDALTLEASDNNAWGNSNLSGEHFDGRIACQSV